MSRKADCYDKAPMENFFHAMRSEPVANTRQARKILSTPGASTSPRLHSAIGYIAPRQPTPQIPAEAEHGGNSDIGGKGHKLDKTDTGNGANSRRRPICHLDSASSRTMPPIWLTLHPHLVELQALPAPCRNETTIPTTRGVCSSDRQRVDCIVFLKAIRLA